MKRRSRPGHENLSRSAQTVDCGAIALVEGNLDGACDEVLATRKIENSVSAGDCVLNGVGIVGLAVADSSKSLYVAQ